MKNTQVSLQVLNRAVKQLQQLMGEDERQNEQFFAQRICLFAYFPYEAIIDYEMSTCSM